ncbi:Retrovirus-related Pol polyprotein from transposon RE2 [Sesamum angolense]|uniref:Retrovirus-related Pol polyprotein from transposon RE2 n=1 Tax=Sesamum angolense TaxID=2727404 RepID=A0AAE1T7M7_9LAMI|nr:Retrovirus-related Pol polyprotein from transposon RE2 [Sesamum angolense]
MARQKILGILLDENGIGYLPQSYFQVNRKSETWGILLVDTMPTRKIMSKNPLTVILDNNEFNGTNYTDWQRNLRIVLDYENQGYIMDKLLPKTLPDGSSSEERETFERWHADHRKVRSIILASMSNDVQKQYDRLDDVASILQRMKEVYAIPDRHTRYVATKEFFKAKMTEGSSVEEHGVKMLSLMEKLEDLKAGLKNDTYIDVILQSLPPSYDPFIINFNMNRLEKSINELINMLVQYETMIKKSALSVLIGEASTSKAKGKRAGRWKRKKGKAKAKTVVVAKYAKSAPVAPVGMGMGKKRMDTQQQSRANDICAYCREKGYWKWDCPNLSSDQGMFVVEVNMVTNFSSWVLDTGCGAHICNDLQVLHKSRKLSKDEVVLRLGDGKAVAAEAVGIINLVVSDRVRLELKDCYFVPSMIKNIISIPLLDNAGFEFLINKNCFHSMKDGFSHLLGHISQYRMKMLVDSKSLEIDNLDNLPAYVCRPLNTQARGGFSYFITFTDEYSRYSYVYLMRYKSEAFVRFKEFKLEVENQTDRKIKTFQSDRGGAYLSGEFIHYLKKNNIVSQWTPPGTPQLNGVAERRNRTLLDMIRSMMSFTELPLSLWGYGLEMAARLLNIAPSKTVAQTPYQIWHGKLASYKYLRVWGSPAYVKRLVGDKQDSRSSLCRFIGCLKETAGYYFYDPSEQKIFISRNAVFLERGTSSAPNVSTDNAPILRREAMSDIDLEKWLEAMKSETDSMSSNQVWTLVAKGYTQRPVVDFEETFSPVAMAKSIQIMLAIPALYDYEIWRMDVKMAFLNGFVEEKIYMDQSEGFTVVGEEHKSYGAMISLKTTLNLCIQEVSRSSILFLVLYVDDILLIGNDIKMLGDTKAWLSTQFSMKDLGEASYILGIKIFRDRSKRILGMTQNSYVEKVLKRFKMEHSKRGFLSMRDGVKLSKK